MESNCDVFISYATPDLLIAESVYKSLRAEGIRCWMASDIAKGGNWAQAIVEAIEQCRLFLLIYSSNSDASQNVLREVTMAADKPDVIILPFRIEDIKPGKAMKYFLATPNWLDAYTHPIQSHVDKLPAIVKKAMWKTRLIAGEVPAMAGSNGSPPVEKVAPPVEVPRKEEAPLVPAAAAAPAAPVAPAAPALPTARRVAISYKRNRKSDETLLRTLESHLNTHGYKVFIDRHVTIGMQWASEIGEQIKSADALIVLLSEAAANSEMVQFEVQVAHDEAHQRQGRPHIIPVRLQYSAPLPDPLNAILSSRQYFLWESEADNERLLQELVAALSAPVRPPIERERLESIGGAVPLDSEYYVVRSADADMAQAIARHDTIILLKGARQMGKTSLLARGLEMQRKDPQGGDVAVTDLQRLGNEQLLSLKEFYIAMADGLEDQLELEDSLADLWNDRRSPNENFDRYMRKQVLAKLEGRLLWGLDEVDRLFTCPFGSEVFALFRTWHNDRALNPSGPWSKLSLAIAYATEAHLFISDINQSPFNVGTQIALDHFTLEQVADLNRRHKSPLEEGNELKTFYRLVSGHPFLVRRGLHEMANRGLSITEFEAIADVEDGPYGDHLRRILVLLARDTELRDALRVILEGKPCPSSEAFYRLRSAGLIDGKYIGEARPRCRLYEIYLRRHLIRPVASLLQ